MSFNQSSKTMNPQKQENAMDMCFIDVSVTHWACEPYMHASMQFMVG